MGIQRGEDRAQVRGNVRHGEDDAGQPVKIGGKVSTSTPSALTDGKRTDAWFDEYGRLHIVGDTAPDAPASSTQGPIEIDITSSTADTQLVAAPGSGFAVNVQSLFVSNSAGSNVLVRLKEGSGGTTRVRAMLRQAGGGFVVNYSKQSWQLPENTGLYGATESSVDSVHFNVMFNVVAV